MNNTQGGELVTLAIIGLIVAARYVQPRRWVGTGSSHGTSAWETTRRLAAAGFLAGRGWILGRTLDGGKLTRMPSGIHTAVFAPTGAGKGVSYVVPTLLDNFTGSMFVFDPKGDLYKQTAKFREDRGQQIILFDPLEKCESSDCFNPLDAIRDPLTFADAARSLAESIVVRSSQGEITPFWNDSAVDVITALIMWTLIFADEEDRNMLTVREAICDQSIFEVSIHMLCKSSDGIARQLGGQLKRQSASEKESAGVISTASTHTAFLSSTSVGKTLSKSTFSLEDAFLKPGTTIYLVLPVEQLSAQRNYLRLITNSFLTFLMRFGDERKNRVTFVLDECALLSNLPALEQAYQLGRSSGIRINAYFQGADQARGLFKDKPNLASDNSDCQVFFGTNSYSTAELISKMLGPSTITISSASNSGSSGWSNSTGQPHTNQGGSGWSTNFSEIGRPLLNEAEVLNLSPQFAICFIRGMRPILLRRIFWFREKSLFYLSKSRSPSLIWLLIMACAIALAWVWMDS